MNAARTLNWGTGIVIAFAIFGVGLAVMIWIALSSPTDLVADDYYQRGLEYEGRIQSIQRAQFSGAMMTVNGTTGGVTIMIPGVARSGEVNGTVTLYRPSDRAMDFAAPLSLDSSGTMRIESPRLHPGLWTVKVEWLAGGARYYEEAKVVLN
jgi:nitrogen fixation protein FixH